MIGINGAAAHLVHPGDLVILISYAQVTDAEARSLRPGSCTWTGTTVSSASAPTRRSRYRARTRSAALRPCRPDVPVY